MALRTLVSDFIHDSAYDALPQSVRHQMHRCLLDLVGVAAAGTATPMSQIIRAHAHRHAPGGPAAPRMLFDGRRVGAPQAALANAATIDSMDGHDGHRLVKGHAGAAVLPAALAFLDGRPGGDMHDLITALAVGYEIALRAGLRLHDSTPEYHSSGAWNALGAAAVGCRLLGLDMTKTGHALGIAEYAAPRAPMMRAIAHPTMVKDSSAWGAQAGVTAAHLAAEGFTGAPAELTAPDPRDRWSDLGSNWRSLEQYLKPYPVCRWAHPAVTAALHLMGTHDLAPDQIEDVEVTTFLAATRLDTCAPETTEEAQYSLPFSVAAVLAEGSLSPQHVLDPSSNPAIQRLTRRIRLTESRAMTLAFPAFRQAAVRIRLVDGQEFSCGPMTANGDPDDPLSDDDLLQKFRGYAARVSHDPDQVGRMLLDHTPRPLEDVLQPLMKPITGKFPGTAGDARRRR